MSPLILHARVYAIAGQYNIPKLKDVAKLKYSCIIHPEIFNTSVFVKSLELIYDTTPESDKGLRNIAVETATDQIKDLCAREDFKVLCTSRGDIAFDIMRSTAEKMRPWGLGYGPTDPVYSPASPVFAPTSPVYRSFGP